MGKHIHEGKYHNSKERNAARRAEFRNYWKNLKASAIALLGGRCVRCGFTDERALQFDHINGGGVAESKTRTTNHYKNIIESVLKKENKYQLLCANCNWIKRAENHEVRKAKK